MIVTSHYMEDIEQLCERIVIIREGEFVYDGPLADILTKYAAHKLIVAQLSAPPEDLRPLAQIGELISREDLVVKFKVKRAQVPEAAALILKHLAVADLSIEEEDIAEIISNLLQDGPA